jgi:O-antigen/teichoic acid export membrane protein
MSNKKKIMSGIAVDYIGSILAVIVGFIVVPYYFDYITKVEFGIWIVISGVVALFTMADLGTDQYLTTVTANDDKFYSDSYTDYISSILLIKIIVAVVISIVAVTTYIFLTALVDIDITYQYEAKITFILSSSMLILTLFFSTVSTVLYARHHYSLINSFTSIFAIITSLNTVLLLSLDYGIVSFPLALLSSAIVQYTILFIYLLKKYPNIRLKIRNFYFIDKKEIIGYTTTFQILKWVHTLRTQYITIVINNLVGAVFVSKYNLTNKIPQLIPNYAIKLVQPFFPTIADLFHKGDIKGIGSIFINISKVLFRMSLFFGISVFILNEQFITLWIGADKYAGNDVMFWLVSYMCMYMAMGAFGIIIYSSKKFEKWTSWSIVEIILAVCLSYVFSLYYGLVGIVAGFVLGSMVTQVYLFIIVLRQLDIGKLYFVKKVLTYSVQFNILPLIVSMFIIYFVQINTWLDFIFTGLILVFSALILEIKDITFSKEIGCKNKIKKAFAI